MTNPGMGWLVLRSAAEKRSPQHPDQRTWVKSGVQRRTFSSESQFGLEISQRFGKMAASEAANGKSRIHLFDQGSHGIGVTYVAVPEMEAVVVENGVRQVVAVAGIG